MKIKTTVSFAFLMILQYACASIRTADPSAMTSTPTLSPFALATIWSTNYSIPTPPNGFPTPFPPEPDQHWGFYKYDGITIISGNNIITTWNANDGTDHKAITITGKNGDRIILIAPYFLKIEKILVGNPNGQGFQAPNSAPSIADINNDGVDEIVISRHDGGNGCMQGLYIYKLGDPATLIADETYCWDYWFEDLNMNGSLELIIQKNYLAYFPSQNFKIAEIMRVPQIFEYVPSQGFISSSCKFKGFYYWVDDSKDVTLTNKPEDPNYDFFISSSALDYVMLGDTEKAKSIVIKGFSGEKEIPALNAIDRVHKIIRSSVCP